ncbi:hypothetical protein TEA_016105 [Camellia sinensis var. sinensis]|uniref:ATPase AAA-type core domain-containing protein n=1 Tax=Camellia sinensis var. sinensis TaxID=542762 RepID=A0A4S4ETX6_CAMSN|nr:hypothetical protein TEA_016105 [Camellia sinensis var. sinensis]
MMSVDSARLRFCMQCDDTSLVRAVVGECDAHLTVISPHSVHRAYAGEGERISWKAFAEASSRAKWGKPSVIFIDEIDALCPRRDSRKEQDIRVASQLFMLMDSNKPTSRSVPQVVVVASINIPKHPIQSFLEEREKYESKKPKILKLWYETQST